MQNSSAECEPIRANNRIQIFDQDGKFTAEWKQFGPADSSSTNMTSSTSRPKAKG
jgi:hypothetical protein